MMLARVSLGAYPTDAYYDPDRPSWLPHWIDTPTENALKWGLYPAVTPEQVYSPGKVYPSPPTFFPKPPSDIVSPGPGAVEEVRSETWERYKTRTQAFFSSLGEDLEAKEKSSIPMWVWLAGAGVLALAVLGGRR